uniref:Serpentine receptor class gamma n=2 Tax=Caenorhabditis tropicalis TaxID=1561998 RepID=A0A1I7U0L5_9PELO
MVSVMIASIAALFIYRHQVIVGDDHWLKFRKRNLILIVGFNYIVYSNMLTPLLLTSPIDQIAAKIEILKHLPCPTKNLLSPEVYVVYENIILFLLYTCVLIVFVGAECGLLSLHAAWILFFSTLRANFSRRTRMLQIQFLFALALQVNIRIKTNSSLPFRLPSQQHFVMPLLDMV